MLEEDAPTTFSWTWGSIPVISWPKPVPCSYLVLLGRELAGSGRGSDIVLLLLAEARNRAIDLYKEAVTSKSVA